MPLFNPHVAPWIISSEAASMAGITSNVLVANAVYLYAFEIEASITITGGRWRTGTTVSGTTDIGLYDANGNLLGHTGATTNVTSTNMSANLISNVTIAPGQYFLALCCSTGTDDYMSVAGGASHAPTSRARIATTAATSGVLPSTTGGYSNNPTMIPAMSLIISGGLA